MAKQNNTILVIGVLLLVIVVYKMGGVPFMGALIMFEEGNEIKFTGSETVTLKEIDTETGLNKTTEIAAVTDVNRYISMQSKYVTNAIIRLYGTEMISNSSMSIDGIRVWTQPTEFTDIEQVDLKDALSDKHQGDTVIFNFHSNTPGSLIVSELNIEWGPTQGQIDQCTATQGTFSNSTLICTCPSSATSFDWETGCAFAVEEPSTESTGGGSRNVLAPSPAPTLQLQAIAPTSDYAIWKIVALVGILGVLIYFFAFEKGKDRGFFKQI